MFKYGLYLLDGEHNVFKESVVPVEGMLHIPGTKIVGVWGELQYKGVSLIESLPYKEENLNEEVVDEILKKVIKRLKNRIEFIKSLEENNGGIKPQKS